MIFKRDFSGLKYLESNGLPPTIFVLPSYLEMAYSVFRSSFTGAGDEENRWNFLLWAFEDESNEIFRDVRKDPYVLELFATPHLIELPSGKSVTMHEYHYRYFIKHMNSFREWGFAPLEDDPNAYLGWFYTRGIGRVSYATETFKNFIGQSKEFLRPISVFNFPSYLEMAYSVFRSSFTGAGDEENRWNFLLWAFEDESNEIFRDVRKDPYVLELFATPHLIELPSGKSVTMHEYHYRYFIKHMNSFREWGFAPLEDDPNAYLGWFYTRGIGRVSYATETFKNFIGQSKEFLRPISVFNFPSYLEMAYSVFRSSFTGAGDEENRWNFLLWAFEDESNEIFRDVRKDPYVLELFATPHLIELPSGKSVTMHEYHYRYFIKHMNSFREWGFAPLGDDPNAYLGWFYADGIRERILYAQLIKGTKS